jgi:cytosine/adenosine deaminase-related metal-dependent hydrolase
MIGRALAWLVRKAAWALGSALGSGVTTSLTFLDHLAWLLGQAASLTKEVAGHLKSLMSMIFRFLGRKLAETVDVTVAFVRWILGMLVAKLASIAQRALRMVG